MSKWIEELILVMAILLIAAVIALAAPPACPPGHLGQLSESERRIRVEQWETAIEQLPEKDRPGARQTLRAASGLSDNDLANCRKGVKKKPKRPFEVEE